MGRWDLTRPEPKTGVTGPNAAETRLTSCPRCRTALRLLRPPVDSTPVRCFSCQAVFSLDPIETAPGWDGAPPSLVPPLTVSAPLPGSRNASPQSDLRPLTLPSFSGAETKPSLSFSVPPPPPLATPPVRLTQPLTSPSSAPTPSVAVLHEPPPTLHPQATAAPGLPVPNAMPKNRVQMLDLSPSESWIAIVVTLGLFAAGIAGGFYVYKTYWTSPTPSMADAGSTEQQGNARDGVIESNSASGPAHRSHLPETPVDSERKTAELVGRWVSRADDGSVSVFDFRSNEVAEYTGAALDPAMAKSANGRWAIMKIDGPMITIDILYAKTGLDVHRILLEQVGPECILIHQASFRGRIEALDQRFVRGQARAP